MSRQNVGQSKRIFGKRSKRANLRRRLRLQPESLEVRSLLTATLVADQVQAFENGDAMTLDVLANDSFSDDYEGDRQITSVSFGSQGGRISINSDHQSLSYTPPADFAGEESFVYFVDNQFYSTVNVSIQSPLQDDEFTLPPDGQAHSLNVLGNDRFWDGYTGARQITLVSTTNADSEVQISADGKSVMYTPSTFAQGRDQFVYIVDGKYSGRATIDLTLPLRYDNYYILQNEPLKSYSVLANDPFWAGYSGAKQITLVSETSNGGSVQISADGRSIMYQPAADAYGWDSLTYVVDNTYEASASFNIQRPVQDDYTEMDYESSNQPISVLTNDYYYDNQTDRQIKIVQRVTDVQSESDQGGSVSISANGQQVLYTPAPGFSGTDSFTYTADGRYPARVSVQVTRPVRNDSLSTYQDTPNRFLDVLSNDFLGNGYTGAKQITSVSDTESGGTIRLDANRLSYTPAENFTGSDSFTYVVDGELEASVHVYVQPLASYDSYSYCVNGTAETYTLNVLANDYFQFGYPGPSVITGVEASDGWAVSISADGQRILATPSSSNVGELTYTVDDTYTASVYVYRTGHLSYDYFLMDQNSPTTNLSVLQNDFQNNHPWDACRSVNYRGAKQITGVSASEHGGTVEVSADGRSVRYSPPTDFVGTDSFTYIVDGQMEATATVNVIQRLLNDEFHVASGQAEDLGLLHNDSFSGGYTGAQRITNVSASPSGAAVSISNDGRTIRYQAAEGFHGSETLVYTVDNQLKAEVTVHVDPDPSDRFPTFDSVEAYREFLIADAETRYQYLFGSYVWNRGDWWLDGDFTSGPAPEAGAGGDRDSSDTNVQVEGVDEADLVEFDADYLYSLAGRELVIMSAWPGEDLAEVSRTLIAGNPVGQYLAEGDDRLTVISTVSEFVPDWEDDTPVDPDPTGGPDFFGDFWWPYPSGEWRYSTIVTVLDVHDRSAPTLVQQTTLEGNYVESRAVGDFVYVATEKNGVAPRPAVVEIIDEGDPDNPDDDSVTRRYETAEEYFARMDANPAELLDAALPNYASVGADGEVVRAGWLNAPEDIYQPMNDGSFELISLTSINVLNDDPGISFTSGVYTTGAGIVYASLDNFYIFDNGYETDIGQVTRVNKFDWDGATGGVEFVAAGFVPGRMLNQFSADEYDGHLRIATSVSNSGSGNWSGQSENAMFVVKEDHGTLEYVGSMQNLALNESIQSVRYFGDRAYVVTYRQIDPLFAIDLSDQTNPQAVGALTLPGFSTYMQFISEDRLLAVGRNTPNGFNGPAMVSLFDVSSLAEPSLIDQFTFERFSMSEAGVDHHAFGYFASHGILALPSAKGFIQRVDKDGDGFRETSQWTEEHELLVFAIDTTVAGRDDDGIELLSSIEHESAVRRSGYIGDYLYSVANDSVKAVRIEQPDVVVGTVDDLTKVEIDPPIFVDPVWPFMEGDFAIAAVQDDLAARLGIASGQVLPVTAERNSDDHLDVVVRVDEQLFLYSDAGGSLSLKEVGFEFDEGASWHNSTLPVDVNGDGQVAPSDALLIINELNENGSHQVESTSLVRAISGGEQNIWLDVNNDGYISPIDALMVTNRLAAETRLDLPAIDDPSSANSDLIDRVFDGVLNSIGDSNLDGRFDSGDLVLAFQAGEYEDDVAGNSTWSDGDWNGDLEFSTADLVLAFQQGHYVAAAVDATHDESAFAANRQVRNVDDVFAELLASEDQPQRLS